jgi:GNAT superfamily N-acetyltransferase
MIDVRPVAGEHDVETWLAVRNAVDPATPTTRQMFERRQARPLQLELLGLLDGEPVGCATSTRHFVDPHGPLLFANVRVLAERRRRGVGTALVAAVAEHARAHGRSGLYTTARGDDRDSLDYFGKRGFTEVLRMQESVLDLAAAQPQAPAPEGVELVRLSERALEAELYDAAVEVERDLVAATPWRTGSFEEWRQRALGAGILIDCSFAAVSDGRVVGYAMLEDDGEGVGGHAITGVRRAWRGRGVATALKRAQIDAARAAGLRELLATNEVGNAPMRGINRRLGYAERLTYVHLSGPLP